MAEQQNALLEFRELTIRLASGSGWISRRITMDVMARQAGSTPLATAIFFSKVFLSKIFRQWRHGYLRCVRRRRGTGWGKNPNTEMPEPNDPPELAAIVVPCCSHKNAGPVCFGRVSFVDVEHWSCLCSAGRCLRSKASGNDRYRIAWVATA